MFLVVILSCLGLIRADDFEFLGRVLILGCLVGLNELLLLLNK